MKKIMIWLAAAVVLGAAAVFCVRGSASRPSKAPETVGDSGQKAKVLDEAVLQKVKGKPSVGREVDTDGKKADGKKKRIRIKVEDTYTPEERRLADDLQSATDENDLDAVRKEVEKIKKQGNADLKSEAMDALAFFGRSALSDLMQFVKDKDQEVIDVAADKIAFVLDEMEEEDNKFKTEVLSTLLSFDGLCSEDAIETFVGQLESIGSGDELLAVQTLVDLIDSGTVGENVKKRAKEAYEFVTGEEYADFKKAERWFAEKADELAAEKAEEEAGDAESAEDVRADADAAVDEE